MKLTFTNEQQKRDYINKLFAIFNSNDEFKKQIEANGNQLSGHEFDDFITSFQDGEEQLNPQKDSNILKTYLHKCGEMYTLLNNMHNSETISDNDMTQLSSLFDSLANNRGDFLLEGTYNSFQIANDYKPYAWKQGAFMGNLVRAVNNMHTAYISEAQKNYLINVSNAMKRYNDTIKGIDKNRNDYLAIVDKYDLHDKDFDAVIIEEQQKIKDIEEKVSKLTTESKQKIDAAQADIIKLQATMVKQNAIIDKYKSAYASVENMQQILKNKMEELQNASDKMLVNQHKIESNNELAKKSIDKLTELRQKREIALAAQIELKERDANADMQAGLAKHKSYFTRYDNINAAYKKLWALNNKKYNINEIIANYKIASDIRDPEEYQNFVSTNNLLTDADAIDFYSEYNEAKMTIIKNFYSNESQQKELVDFFQELENNPKGNAISSFVSDYRKTIDEKLAQLEHDQVESSKNYGALLGTYQQLKEQVAGLNDITADIAKEEQVVNDLKAENETLQTAILDDERILKETTKQVYNAIGAGSKYKEGSYKDYVALLDMTDKAKAEFQNKVAKLSREEKYVETKKKISNLQKDIDGNIAAAFKKKIDEQLDIQSGASEKITAINNAQSIKTAMKSSFETINAARNEIVTTISNEPFDINGRLRRSIEEKAVKLSLTTEQTPREKNSDQYNELKDKITEYNTAVRGKNLTKQEHLAFLNDIQEKAQNYLDAKNKQFRPWPFASKQRYIRLDAAKDILQFCKDSEEMLSSIPEKYAEKQSKLSNIKNAIQYKSTDKLLSDYLKSENFIKPIDHENLNIQSNVL